MELHAAPDPVAAELVVEQLPTSTEPVHHDHIVVRYAETDDDVIAIHRFLLVVAQPAMRCPVDVEQSLMEIIRVTKENVALMVLKGGLLVGTMGLIDPAWWYNPKHRFMADRWHFVLPEHQHGPVNRALIDEARKIAADAGLEFIHQGKIREKGGAQLMMPRAYPVQIT
ncbi:hypothetical protein [Bradyrhizobium sp. JR5.3]|uniref:hypothetical protein n=1 Tax=Bradyrhizobium sp. JR5.3 TaxID=3156374 RepID=UPI003391C305